VSCHLSAYKLISIIDERQKSALAIHLVHPMLDKGVEREVAAGLRIRWRAVCDVERK
jgi:hypothetical protein